MTQISRRAFLTTLLAGSALPLQAAPLGRALRPVARPETLGQPPDGRTLLAEAGLTGQTAFALGPLGGTTLLESHGQGATLPPASVAKCITALYAVSALGAGHRFRTRLLATGPIRDGRLQGDLILAGGGDPTLDTMDLNGLAGAMKQAGLREVTGRFLYSGAPLPDLALIDVIQPDQVSYNPGVSGLTLNYNRVYFEWSRESGDWRATMDARAGSLKPRVTTSTMRIVDGGGPIYTLNATPDGDAWTVARSALGNGGARWLPVRRPAAYAAEVFQVLARSQGIVLPAPVPANSLPADARLIAHHDSPVLFEIAREMLKYSNNLTAELLGLSASVARGRRPDSLRESAMEMSRWCREAFGLQDIALVDHSGLGDASRISANDLVRFLQHDAAQVALRPILKEIPTLDARGNRERNPSVAVHAKTGTLNFVSCLAGYIEARDGKVMAFAIMSGDVARRDSLARSQRERPPGGRAWTRRARMLQQGLIRRWGDVFG